MNFHASAHWQSGRRNFISAFFWVVVAGLGGVLYLREPWLGDDLDYWSFAIHFHEPDFGSDLGKGFHALRWPVWGPIWVFQHVLPKGLPSYYAQPIFYFAMGALVMWLWARQVFGVDSKKVAVAMVVYLFHPLLAVVAHRPMPDLSEGFWMACVMLAWWHAMRAERLRRTLLPLVLGGLFLQLCFANRFTGLIIVPVMVLCTVLLFPRQWRRAAVMLAVFGVFFLMEALVYQFLHGNFWHAIAANADGRGRPGTEPVPLWSYPFRFFSALWEGNVLKVFFTTTALLGGVVMWRGGGVWRTGRFCVLWAVLLYLGYSCAVQGVNPVRPLIRDGDRFIASLAWPMALLTAAGVAWLATFIRRRWEIPASLRRLYPVAVVIVILVLAASAGRKFQYGFSQELAEKIASTADGTRVASHSVMRDLVALTNFEKARKIIWEDVDGWYQKEVSWDEIFARNDELWMRHKEAWLKRRKQLEREEEDENFVPLFFALGEPIMPERVISLDRRPDLFFFSLSKSDGASPSAKSVFVKEDWEVVFKKGEKFEFLFDVPASEGGRTLGIFYDAMSNRIQPFSVRIEFLSRGKSLDYRELLMYFNPVEKRDAVFCDVPEGTDGVRLVLRCRHSSEKARVSRLEVLTLAR